MLLAVTNCIQAFSKDTEEIVIVNKYYLLQLCSNCFATKEVSLKLLIHQT